MLLTCIPYCKIKRAVDLADGDILSLWRYRLQALHGSSPCTVGSMCMIKCDCDSCGCSE